MSLIPPSGPQNQEDYSLVITVLQHVYPLDSFSGFEIIWDIEDLPEEWQPLVSDWLDHLFYEAGPGCYHTDWKFVVRAARQAAVHVEQQLVGRINQTHHSHKYIVPTEEIDNSVYSAPPVVYSIVITFHDNP